MPEIEFTAEDTATDVRATQDPLFFADATRFNGWTITTTPTATPAPNGASARSS